MYISDKEQAATSDNDNDKDKSNIDYEHYDHY